jgi:hypothetical protein
MTLDASDPYRSLAKVDVEAPEAPPLVKYATTCSACGRGILDDPWFCRGGRHGFLWHRACVEQRPHLHRQCARCGAKWLSEPVENSDHVKR